MLKLQIWKSPSNAGHFELKIYTLLRDSLGVLVFQRLHVLSNFGHHLLEKHVSLVRRRKRFQMLQIVVQHVDGVFQHIHVLEEDDGVEDVPVGVVLDFLLIILKLLVFDDFVLGAVCDVHVHQDVVEFLQVARNPVL